MILIAHRGNINGKNETRENTISYILEAIEQGFDVEIDVWFKNENFYLGHDEPKEKINFSFLQENKKLWIHCKNIEALYKLQNACHCFFHENDKCTLTSGGYIWTFPGNILTPNSICVMPELNNEIPINCAGVCSDYIEKYKKICLSY